VDSIRFSMKDTKYILFSQCIVQVGVQYHDTMIFQDIDTQRGEERAGPVSRLCMLYACM
jgi:hypothetical protein